MADSDATQSIVPRLNPHGWQQMYLQGKHAELSKQFLDGLNYFNRTTYFQVDSKTQYFIDSFVLQFLYFFSRPDFRPPDADIVQFVSLNLLISNLVAMSSFRTTDGWLELLRFQEANYFKILTLYSARNSVKFNRQVLIETNPELASIWYSRFAQIYRGGLLNEHVVENLKEHLSCREPGIDFGRDPQDFAFGVTYLDQQLEREVKPLVNQAMKMVLNRGDIQVRSQPDFRKIAIMSSMWHQNHSVYRILSENIHALKGYDLTFVQFGNVPPPDADRFERIIKLEAVQDKLALEPLLNNNFGTVIFPDIGMSQHSVLLSNLRMAPIQICSLGHPVSTWGAEIDYFISGAEAEPLDHPEANYSERLVLLPGSGAIHNVPNYTATGRKKQTSDLIIGGCWLAQKVNRPFSMVLRDILKRTDRPVRFRVFAGSALTRANEFIPFLRDFQSALNSRTQIEVVPPRPYPQYMELLEESDLYIDSFHFGGGNTITDALFLRKPTVTWEGNRWYNRIGSQMLRMVGLDELIATNANEYIELTLRLIEDDTYRERIERKLQSVNLDQTLFSTKNADAFRQAIDYLITNHDQLQRSADRTPIRIPDLKTSFRSEPPKRAWGRIKK